jgi:hypothetical protein
MSRTLSTGGLAAALLALAPAAASACACGCGVFDVGAGTFMPNNANSGLEVWFRLANMDQDQNWEGASKAPASDNGDKSITTTFYFVGAQYVVNRDWTVMAQLPYYDRRLTTTDDGTVYGPAGTVYAAHDVALGDLELMAIYTGFSKDGSTGAGFGVKAPTGDFKGPVGPLGGDAFDRDSLPGTGTTDVILSGYHVGSLNTSNTLSYFIQGKYQVPLAPRDGYRPGNELDAAVGVAYDLGSFGPVTKVEPVLQVLNSYRLHDTGPQADELNSGYERVLLDPAVSIRIKQVRFDADVAVPLYQHTNSASSLSFEGTSGQLTAKTLLRFQVSYDF